MNQSHIGGVGSVTTIGGVAYVRIAARDLQVGDMVKSTRVVSVTDEEGNYYLPNARRVVIVTEGITETHTGAFGSTHQVTTKDNRFEFMSDEAVQIRQR